VSQRRVEAHGQRVRRAVAQRSADVEGGGTEHVAVAADRLAVEVDGGEGVHAVKDQAVALAGRGWGRGAVEAEAVPPLLFLHPADGVLVAVVEGILDPASGEDGAVHVAGDGHIDPIGVVEAGGMDTGGQPGAGIKVVQLPEVEHRAFSFQVKKGLPEYCRHFGGIGRPC